MLKLFFLLLILNLSSCASQRCNHAKTEDQKRNTGEFFSQESRSLYPKIYHDLPLPDEIKDEHTYTEITTSLVVSIPKQKLIDFYTDYFLKKGLYGANLWFSDTLYRIEYKCVDNDGSYPDNILMEIEELNTGNTAVRFIK